MPVPSKAQLAAQEAARADAVQKMTARLGDMTPGPGQFAVTIRIDRPDGQFVTSTRLVPDDLLGDGEGIDGRLWYTATAEIGAKFVSAYQRSAELPE